MATNFELLKTAIEKQIIVVLDFLTLDKQIKAFEVKQISQFVIDDLDKSQNSLDLYASFYRLLSTFSILQSYLEKTFKSLAKYSHV
jgi:hypothetical protein